MIKKKKLFRLAVSFMAVLPFGFAFLPASAQSNSDWYRRQQQQQQQQQQQRQLEQQRQQQRQREQQQQQMRQQMREQMQQQQRQQMQQRLREQQQQQMRQQQQRGRLSEVPAKGGVQRRTAQPPSIVSQKSDRIVYSNGVARLNRPLTAGEVRRGFTGKVTQDGRALVKINGRVLAVPAARVGIRTIRSQSTGTLLASRWSPSKRALISDDVRKLATTNLKNKARTGGGGRRPPGGGGGESGGGSGEPPRRVAANENNPRARLISGFLARDERTIRDGLRILPKKRKGFDDGYRNMPGGAQAAKHIFKSVTGREPFRQRETFIVADKRGKKIKTITYRPAENSTSGMPKIQIDHHDLKISEKISFEP